MESSTFENDVGEREETLFENNSKSFTLEEDYHDIEGKGNDAENITIIPLTENMPRQIQKNSKETEPKTAKNDPSSCSDFEDDNPKPLKNRKAQKHKNKNKQFIQNSSESESEAYEERERRRKKKSTKHFNSITKASENEMKKTDIVNLSNLDGPENNSRKIKSRYKSTSSSEDSSVEANFKRNGKKNHKRKVRTSSDSDSEYERRRQKKARKDKEQTKGFEDQFLKLMGKAMKKFMTAQ